MASEANVQIEVPRTGQKIRNLSVDVIQGDGTTATVLMQVVALSDEQGNLLNVDALDALAELTLLAREQCGLLRILVNGLFKTNVAPGEAAD